MDGRRLLSALAAGLALAAGPAGAEPAPRPDPLAGRALFIGARPLASGGPPCGACHAIGGAAAPFAASLGPELSAALAGLDAAAVEGLLEDPTVFPTMAPLYAGRPLTGEERADLGAFLLQATGKPAPSGARVATCAALLVTAALGALGLARRRRPGPARAALVPRPRRARRVTGPEAAAAERPAPPAPRAHGGAR
jgi:mono/diheme cytochrome c family protein